jgi:hypothetical protein
MRQLQTLRSRKDALKASIAANETALAELVGWEMVAAFARPAKLTVDATSAPPPTAERGRRPRNPTTTALNPKPHTPNAAGRSSLPTALFRSHSAAGVDPSAIKAFPSGDTTPWSVPAFAHPYKNTDRITPRDAPSAPSIPTFLNPYTPKPDAPDRGKPAAKTNSPDRDADPECSGPPDATCLDPSSEWSPFLPHRDHLPRSWFTLNPTPYTLNPKPSTLTPKPQTPNPKL